MPDKPLFGALKALVLRWTLVPPEPHVPHGSPESVRVFRAGRNYYYLLLLQWLLGHLIPFVALSLLSGAASVARVPPTVRAVWLALLVLAWTLFALSLAFTFLTLRLNYELRWYIVTDRSLRIRSGIIRVQEITMTFANIQDIRVTANPLERLLGLANVEVHSAGGGGGEAGGQGHLGQFAGVENASTIRDLIVDRLRAYRDSGLGDRPLEAISPAEAIPNTAIDEARRVLTEVRALGAVITGQR